MAERLASSPARGGAMVDALARLRVPLGFAFGAVFLWLSRPSLRLLLVGGSVAVVGEALRIWAAGHLEKAREVTQSGPYRWTRHPLYMGSAIIGTGAAIASSRLFLAVMIGAYLVATIVSAIRTEEAAMRASFGDRYDDYARSRARPVERAFSLRRAWRNKEYRAVIGLMVVLALLALKVAVAS